MKNYKMKQKNSMQLVILISILIVGLIIILLFMNFNTSNVIVNDPSLKEFNKCLAENGVVIYGTDNCPYCRQLVEILGGYEAVSPIYVDCIEQQQRCMDEMQGIGVPEIQINNQLYQGPRTLQALSQQTGCPIP